MRPYDTAHDELRATVRRLGREHLVPIADEVDRTDVFPRGFQRILRDAGLVQLGIPEAAGGPGGGRTAVCIAREELARAGSMALANLVGQNSVLASPLLELGTDAQIARYLPALLDGELACVCITEPGAGSDPLGMRTRARRDGDGWVIDGEKAFIGWGKLARYALLFARTGDSPGGAGISGFVVDTQNPGFVESRHNSKMGQRGIPNVDLRFDGLRVSGDSMLGAEGEGFSTVMRGLYLNRPTIASIAVGGALAALDCAIRHVTTREQRGRKLSDNQGVRWMLAEMATDIEAARALVYECARQIDEGAAPEEIARLSSMSKYFASEVAVKVSGHAVQLLGAAGYMRDLPAERYFRDARVTTIYEGTTEIQKNTISRELLRAASAHPHGHAL